MSKSWIPEKSNYGYDDYDEPAAMEGENFTEEVKVSNVFEEHKDENAICWRRFKRQLRGCWATKHTEDTEDDRQLYIKTTIRELVVYIFFLLVMMIATFGMTSGLLYYYTNILSNLFISSNFADGTGPYTSGSSMNDLWKFLTGPLLSGLYWNQWYNNNPMAKSEINYIYYENKLIGVPRLRQVRVRSNSCVVPSDFKKDIVECYAPYSYSLESSDSFGPANSTAWVYSTEASLKGRSSTGTITTYSGGGFYVDLNLTQTDSLNTINYLFNNLWINKGTRAVIIAFTVYNANINLFCVVKMIAEFPATGGMIPNAEFRTVKLIRYVTPMDYFVMAFEIIFICFIIYYIFEEIIEIRKHRFTYFFSLWNCVDIIVIVISVICAGFNIYRTFAVNNFLEDMLAQTTIFPDFDFLSYWQLQFNNAVAFTVFLSWIKIFKYISFNKTMTQLSSTLSRCATDLMGFAIIFFIVFLAFAQLGYLMFGSQCLDFRAFNISIYTLFRIILGDFNFNALQQAQSVLGPLYFMLYVFFVFFVLFNMFMAIITDTYAEVKEDLAGEENEFEMGDFFKERAQMILQKLNVRKEKLSDIVNAIGTADSNNDNILDFEEWRTELKKRGFADAEIENVFSKYDTDGDRRLDEDERRVMQKELEGQKDALNNEIDKTEFQTDGPSAPVSAVSMEEYHILNVRVDRMEGTISIIVTKIEGVLENLEKMERSKLMRREAMKHIFETLAVNTDLSEEERRKKLEEIVSLEINKIDTESMVSIRPKSGRTGLQKRE